MLCIPWRAALQGPNRCADGVDLRLSLLLAQVEGATRVPLRRDPQGGSPTPSALNSGQQLDLSLENQSNVYAETPFGELEISVADLRQLDFFK